jgi:hypothetical protein
VPSLSPLDQQFHNRTDYKRVGSFPTGDAKAALFIIEPSFSLHFRSARRKSRHADGALIIVPGARQRHHHRQMHSC